MRTQDICASYKDRAKLKEIADSAFSGLDFDVDLIVPPMAFQPIPGEECTSPSGIRMFVTRTTEYDSGIVVSGTVIQDLSPLALKDKRFGKRKGADHCFIYRFVPFPQ